MPVCSCTADRHPIARYRKAGPAEGAAGWGKSMANFYYSYGSVPELQPLTRDERVRVLRISGGAYGKTPAYRRGLWLMLLLSYVAPLAVGATCYLAFEDWFISVLIGLIALQVGHSIWFHLRLVHL